MVAMVFILAEPRWIARIISSASEDQLLKHSTQSAFCQALWQDIESGNRPTLPVPNRPAGPVGLVLRPHETSSLGRLCHGSALL